jgi:hypothetical protein
MNFASTGDSRVQSLRCCVLFDPADGTIHHMHQVVTIAGAAETPEAMIEQRARQLAKELGVDTTTLQALHVDPAALRRGVRYAVGTANRCLVEVGRLNIK